MTREKVGESVAGKAGLRAGAAQCSARPFTLAGPGPSRVSTRPFTSRAALVVDPAHRSASHSHSHSHLSPEIRDSSSSPSRSIPRGFSRKDSPSGIPELWASDSPSRNLPMFTSEARNVTYKFVSRLRGSVRSESYCKRVSPSGRWRNCGVTGRGDSGSLRNVLANGKITNLFTRVVRMIARDFAFAWGIVAALSLLGYIQILTQTSEDKYGYSFLTRLYPNGISFPRKSTAKHEHHKIEKKWRHRSVTARPETSLNVETVYVNGFLYLRKNYSYLYDKFEEICHFGQSQEPSPSETKLDFPWY